MHIQEYGHPKQSECINSKLSEKDTGSTISKKLDKTFVSAWFINYLHTFWLKALVLAPSTAQKMKFSIKEGFLK